MVHFLKLFLLPAMSIPLLFMQPAATRGASLEAGASLPLGNLLRLPPTDEPVLATELQGQNSAIEAIAISPDGALLAAAGAEGFIDLWRLPGYEPAGSLAGSAYAVHTLDFSPDGATLAAGGHDGILRLWDVSALKERQAFRPTLATIIYRLDYSPDGGTLAVGTQLCVVQIVGSDDGILRRTLPQRGCGASSLRWVQSWGIDHLPDGEAILTGDGRGCCGGSVQRWVQDRFEPPVDPGGLRPARPRHRCTSGW